MQEPSNIAAGLTASAALRSTVTALGVEWQYRPLEPEPGLAALLAQPALDEGAKATVVQALGAGLIDVCIAHGYQSMDLVVLPHVLEFSTGK